MPTLEPARTVTSGVRVAGNGAGPGVAESMLLKRLGLPRIWGSDVEGAWSFMRYWLAPATMALAPSHAYGGDRMPGTGGAVLAANHLSAVDPPLVGIFSRRAVWYMTKAELLAVPIIGELFSFAGGFPIRRGEGDRDGLRTARELVREGFVIGIFAEGTRQRLGYPGPIHPGAVMIAMQESVPVLPVGLESFRWSLRNRRPCCVVFGEPMRFDDYPRNGPGYRAAARELQAEIVRLWRQAAEALAAEFPPALPDGTPRCEWVRAGADVRAWAAPRLSA